MKKVTFGKVNVHHIGKESRGYKVALSHGKPTRNMFPEGPIGNSMFINAAARWARHQKKVPKKATFTNANAAARALANAFNRAKKLNEEIKENNRMVNEIARILRGNNINLYG